MNNINIDLNNIDIEDDNDDEYDNDVENNNDAENDDENLWIILDNIIDDNIDKTKNKLICSSCKSTNLIYTSGRCSYVCSDCGLENLELYDESPEWNNYEDKEDNSRCGTYINPFYPKSSLGTTINAVGYSKVKMLRSWGQVSYKEKSLSEVLNDIDGKCKKYNVTKAIIDNTKILYRNIRDLKNDNGKNIIIRGINRKQIIAACLYFGAILQKFPRSTKEVSNIFGLEIKQVTKGCKNFLDIMKDNFIIFDIKPSRGYEFIERYGTKLKLTKETIQLAKIISENSIKLDLTSEHQATSLAAASILLAINVLKETINKISISKLFNISDVTISKTYNKMNPYKNILIDDELTNKVYYKMNLNFMSNSLNNELENDLSTIEENDSDTKNIIDYLNNIELDESDVIKIETSKYEKNIKLVQEKEKKKENKIQLKEDKIQLKQQIKLEQKEIKKQLKKQLKENEELVKKKRGRPKKQNNIENSI
jgi:transcription initiation factor TFIIB